MTFVFNRIRGMAFLLLSAVIMSASTPVLAKLIQLGDQHLINGHNPISFCNVLFASSFVALFALIILYKKELKTFDYSTLNSRDWIAILLTAVISGTLIPTLYFYGVEYGNIINIILIMTLQSPLYILSGWIFLRQKPQASILISVGLTSIGVLMMILLEYYFSIISQHSAPSTDSSKLSTPYLGEICIFIAILLKTLSTLIIVNAVKKVPDGIFNVFSMLFGVIFFFSVVMSLFGFSHFVDLFSPFLWQWMLFYGVVIIALRIYTKFIGLKRATMAEIAICNSMVPFASVFISFIILGALPKWPQFIGGGFILLGICVSLYSKLNSNDDLSNNR